MFWEEEIAFLEEIMRGISRWEGRGGGREDYASHCEDYYSSPLMLLTLKSSPYKNVERCICPLLYTMWEYLILAGGGF